MKKELENNIDPNGFQVINTPFELAIRMKHKDIKGDTKDVTVHVHSVTPILTDDFAKELVEVVKKIIK